MENIFEFNGNKYRLRKLDLDLLHRASPLLIKYRELHFKYTNSIDTTMLDEAENEILIIKNALDDLHRESTPDKNRINRLLEKSAQAEYALNTAPLKGLKQFVSDMEALALYEIITDSGFIAGLLNSILVSSEPEGSINFSAEELAASEALEFIKQVISSFFLIMPALSVKQKTF